MKLALPQASSAPRQKPRPGFDFGTLLLLLFIVVPVVGSILRGIFGRVLGSTVGGGVVGFAAWVLAGSLAMVDQDLFMFAGSVRDNLTLWDATIADKDLMAACRDADVLDVIARLRGGLDAELAEGASNLSGGQRQRIEIARALARDPAILVLNEATSALDSESERIVDANLRKRGCTCIIIAHRLAAVRGCDRIIAMQDGRIVEDGSHRDLIARPDSLYGRLWHLQSYQGAEQGAAA